MALVKLIQGKQINVNLTGSFTGSFTGSLFGTASWATNARTASFITGSNVFGPFGSNSVISASFAVSSSRSVSSSFAQQAESASFANTSQTSNETNAVNGFQAATVEQINVGEAYGNYAYIVRAYELEQSKHSTINVYNNLNFT